MNGHMDEPASAQTNIRKGLKEEEWDQPKKKEEEENKTNSQG